MRIPKLAIILLACAGFAAGAAERITDYAWQAEIETEGAATWYRAEIPVSVQWRAAHADLRDLRVFNADGESLPFALVERLPQVVQKRREVTARMFPLYSTVVDPEPDATPVAAPVPTPVPEVALDSGLRVRRDASGNVEIEVIPPPIVRARPSPPPPSPPQRSSPRTRKVQRGWLLDVRAADFPLERLSLDLAATGKEGFFSFSIEASDDLERWRPVGQGQLVRLSFDGQDILQRDIDLPNRSTARYLRLIWDDTEVAVGVRGVRLSGAVTGIESSPLTWSRAVAGEASAEREREYLWRWPVSLPLMGIRVVLDEANILAPVVFSGRDFQPRPPAAAPAPVTERRPEHRRLRDVLRGQRRDERARTPAPAPIIPAETPWQVLASGVVYRLPADAGERVVNELNLSGAPVNQLRLRIDPRGSGLGAGAPRIEVGLRGRELSFLARGRGPYRVAVGRADAQAANLPLTTLIPANVAQATGRARVRETGIERAAPPPVPVAAPVSAPVVSPPPSEPLSSDTGKLVLWAVLIAGVILLGGMVFSLTRSMKKSREESASVQDNIAPPSGA